MLSSANAVANQSSIVEFPLEEMISGSLAAYWEALSKPHPEGTIRSTSTVPLSAGRLLVLGYLRTVNSYRNSQTELAYCQTLSAG